MSWVVHKSFPFFLFSWLRLLPQPSPSHSHVPPTTCADLEECPVGSRSGQIDFLFVQVTF